MRKYEQKSYAFNTKTKKLGDDAYFLLTIRFLNFIKTALTINIAANSANTATAGNSGVIGVDVAEAELGVADEVAAEEDELEETGADWYSLDCAIRE